jgi:pyrimidine deaminase RibD-like protein
MQLNVLIAAISYSINTCMNITQLESFQLSDAISLHDKLNPKLFVNNKPRIEVKQQLLKIAKDFISELGIKDLDVKDITISGSNAAYTYTPHSDLDLHILVDMSKLPNDEVYKELFNAKKTIYNDTHDIKIHGIPVELYVQDSAEPVISLGEYSLMKNKWLRIPVKRRASFDQNITKSKYNKLHDLIQVALKSNSQDKVSELLKTLRRYRQVGLDKTGEFSPENLAYKALRSQGWLTKLYSLRDKLHSRDLSIESIYATESKIMEAKPQYKEIEFVCANPEFPDATDPKLQRKMYDELKKIPGVIPLLQDQGDYSEGQMSLTAIYKDPNIKSFIFKLAKSLGVVVDLIQPVTDNYVDRAIRGEHEGQITDEDYDPNGPPPGPEFKPTMPAGTVKVDVSDVYDWYKLGQHISSMKGLGKHDFGKGPPSTILSFGDEDTEHKYIKDLQKTGLTTTDIDPIDPKQPKGMKKQKVDPTYNVNEKANKLKESVNTKDEIYNYPKLDRILKKISDLVIKGQNSDKDYGMVGAGVLDSDNRLVARLNYPVSKGKRVHAERAAIEAYESKYGTLPEDSIIITTLSPCNEYGTDMADEREGDSCTDYLNSKGIKKVYCGYMDPSQDNDDREFNIIETSDKNLRKLCKQFADTFLENDIHESSNKDIVQEGISPIVYHYTRAITARNILSTGEFQLSSTLGSVEEQYAPKGYPYFLSTTRTRRGGYHDFIGSDAVLFVLDGTWYSRHYKGAPIDYWLNRDPLQSNHRAHEAEDRIFSKDPTMSIGGVTAIHIYVSPDAEAQTNAWARQALILSKRTGIQAYFYTDKEAWRNQDTRKMGDVSVLKGQDTTRGYVSSHKGYLIPWIELVNAKDKSQLSKKADALRYSLQYSYDKESAAQGLANDLSNARKPNSGPDREHAVNIIKYMQANKLNTVKDLVNNLTDKWKSVEKVDESASGYIPSESEKNDPRYKTALTVDVKPDTLKKNAKAFGFKVNRAGIPPLLRADK